MDVIRHDHIRPQIHILELLPRPLPLFVGNRANVVQHNHAIRHLSNTQGLPTNATFGYTQILIKVTLKNGIS